MISFIKNLFKKPKHVCTDFTVWQMKQREYTKTFKNYVRLDGTIEPERTVELAKYYQERSCKICGKIQQEELKF